ncbi:hypothetical protein QYE76_035502 [Lolium multiflorum]|uniref:Transposase (putative) gypsy type domain-containing protein n=1 Tax=Lolium multiflorum TaxID=4521 RepID=A0AAD8R1Q8_LOLMU|nr:hypothetical protein QYE76_035502 [Lolium multiflorum]
MATVDLGAAEWERSKISTQDINMLKKLGISKKPKALCFPSEESYPTPPMGYRVSFVDHLIRGLSAPIHPFLLGLLFIYGLQLHHLTPNSILHISIFITLCEAFLGVQPNWALWKRIFFCRRNGSPNVAYNIGGVVISVRPTVDYFDVKLPDSVQGWHKKWLYIQEENHGCAEDNIPPFDGAEKIFRRRSWDAEATEEERVSTETLMARIYELQNTRGKELSGVQITAYFLRTRVQPLQARKYPLWKYAGDKDVDRLSVNLEVKDLEKLVRKISSLSKKDAVPSSCRVTPFSAANPLPKNHPDLVSLPPLPEGTASALSPRPAVSPKGKRKRNDVEDSGTSKAEEVDPSRQKATYDPYLESLVSSDDEEEVPTFDVAPRTSTSHTLLVSDTPVEGEESSPPQQNVVTTIPPSSPLAPSPKRTRIETIIEPAPQLGSSSTPLLDDRNLQRPTSLPTLLLKNWSKVKRPARKPNLLLAKPKQRLMKPRQKLLVSRNEKRLEDTETALNEHKAAQATREKGILKRLNSQNRRFQGQTNQEFDLENPDNDPLLDALSYLEFHGSEIREGVVNADAGLSKLFPYFFPKKEEPKTFLALAQSFNPSEDLGLKMRQENMKIAVESTVALVADSQQTVDWMKVGDTEQIEQTKWRSLIKAAKPNTKKILAYLGIKPSSTPSSSRPEV